MVSSYCAVITEQLEILLHKLLENNNSQLPFSSKPQQHLVDCFLHPIRLARATVASNGKQFQRTKDSQWMESASN